MFKKIITFLFILLFVIIGSAFLAFNTRWFYRNVAPQIANLYLKDIKIKSLDFQNISFRFPARWVGKDATCHLSQQAFNYDLSIKQVVIDFVSVNKVHITIDGADTHTSFAEAKQFNLDMSITLTGGDTYDIEGHLRGNSVNAYKLKAENITTSLQGDEDKIFFHDFSARSYQGKINGHIVVEYAPKISYIIQLGLADVNVGSMKGAYPDVFSQIEGKLEGTVHIVGDPAGVQKIDTAFAMAKEGKIKASLLSFFIAYIPQSVQRKELEALIADNGVISLDKALLSLKSDSAEKLATNINLSSQKFNLDMNLAVDINLEGGIKSLFKQLENFSK